MSERLEGRSHGEYELPLEAEGEEVRLEKAKEGVGTKQTESQRPPTLGSLDASTPAVQAATAPVQSDSTVALPPATADSPSRDLEKQVVEKAKHIIRETSADPYQQKIQISQLKSDYQSRQLGRQVRAQEVV